MPTLPITSHSSGLIVLATAAAALVLPTLAMAAPPAEGLAKLFELGAHSTPSAVTQAAAQYRQLKDAGSSDPRVDYAFAVVLVNQRQYRDAMPLIKGYLETDKPQPAAYCLKIRAEILLHNFGQVLEDATALAERFPAPAQSQADQQFSDAAHFLGVIFAYLETVRPTAVVEKLREDCRREVVERMGNTYQKSFGAGERSVKSRLAQLQAEHTSELAKRESRLERRKQQEKSTAETAREAAEEEASSAATHHVDSDVAQQSLASVAKQLPPLENQRNQLQMQLIQLKLLIEQIKNSRAPNRSQELQQATTQRTTLEKQLSVIKRDLLSLERKTAWLASTAAMQKQAEATSENKASVAQRQAATAEQRAQSAQERLSSSSDSVPEKLMLLANYAPFPYEQERNRVLGWFGKAAPQSRRGAVGPGGNSSP